MAAGDPVTVLHRDEHRVTVLAITRLESEGYYDLDELRRAVAVEALGQGWRDAFMKRLERFL